jgi:hypothetical protein
MGANQVASRNTAEWDWLNPIQVRYLAALQHATSAVRKFLRPRRQLGSVAEAAREACRWPTRKVPLDSVVSGHRSHRSSR